MKNQIFQDDNRLTHKQRITKALCLGIPILVLVLATSFLILRLFGISASSTTLGSAAALSATSAIADDTAEESAVCAYNDDNALICAPADAESNRDAIPEGYIICIKDAVGNITCTDGHGNLIPADCTISGSGDIDCIRKDDGKTIENILTCTPVDAKTLSCTRKDGSIVEIILNKDIIVEVEKEIIKEVEKEVIVEKEIIVEKSAPSLTARHQTPTEVTNGNVTLTLTFNKEVKLPDGWAYGTSKKEIRRTITANTNATLNVSDLAGNTGQTSISITNIDKTPPTCTSEVAGGGAAFTYTITCNESISIPGWGKIIDTKYAQFFTTSQHSKTVQATDSAGNTTTITLN